MNKLNRLLDTPVMEEKRQEAPSSDPVVRDNEEAPVPRHGSHHVVPFLVQTLFRAGQGKIHIDALQHMRVGHQRSCWIECSSPAIKSRVFNFLC